jgi:hypothetical protein
MNERIPARNAQVKKDVKRALASWATKNGHAPNAPEHDEIADEVLRHIEGYLKVPASRTQSLRLWAQEGEYSRVEVVNETGSPEELLYPLDPETDEPVDQAVCDVVWSLPDLDHIPDI